MNIQDIRDLGGNGGAKVQPVSRAVFNETIAKLTAIASGSREHALFTTEHAVSESAAAQRVSELKKAQPYICYAAKPNSILIRSNGRIGKCTVALSDPRNDIGSLKADGTLELDPGKLLPWIRGLEQLNQSQLACPLNGLSTDALGSVESMKAIPAVLSA